MSVRGAVKSQPAAGVPGQPARFTLVLLAAVVAMGLIVFLLWQSGQARPDLTEAQIREFLKDDSDPALIKYAITQVQQRMQRKQPVTQFYPQLVQLATHRSEDVRHGLTQALASDVSRPEFRQALLGMLHQQSTLVRNAAALSLAAFGDGTGHEHILAMLQTERVTTPHAGKVKKVPAAGTFVQRGEIVMELRDSGNTIEVRSPLTGRIQQVEVREGDVVSAGVQVAQVTPSADQAMAALRALERVGQAGDLPAISAYMNKTDTEAELVQQAKTTEQAIRKRQAQR